MKLRLLDHLGSTGRLSLAPWCRLRLLISLAAAVASIGLSGCGPHRVRADFAHYEDSYAVTSNREVLLNLARLQQHDPTYFFKLGQINSSYRMSATLTGTGNLATVSSPPATTVPVGGGTPGLVYENDPSFSFIPVNDETNARLLMNPVSEDLFYNLYQQGWRVDQLFRLMVDRIEVTLPPKQGEKGCHVEIIRNVPPPYYGLDSQSALTLSRYVTFLRVSAVVYALQKHGLLLLEGTQKFQPLDNNSWLRGDKPEAGGDAANSSGKDAGAGADPPAGLANPTTKDTGTDSAKDQTGGGTKSQVAPVAKDFDDAAAKSQVWELQTDNKWRLGQKVLVPRFQLTSTVPESGPPKEDKYGDNVAEIENNLRTQVFRDDPSLSVLQQAPELTDILEILYSGFAIGGMSNEQEAGNTPCNTAGSGSVSSHLVMRSLIGLMAAAAQEQAFFDEMDKDKNNARGPIVHVEQDPLVADIHNGLLRAQKPPISPDSEASQMPQSGVSIPTIHFNDLVPSIERIPVLRLTWFADTKPPKAPGANPREIGMALTYRGREYEISDGDFKDGNEEVNYAQENETWNRDMFRLICQLSSQVTVDISKFPLPEILQLRTE